MKQGKLIGIALLVIGLVLLYMGFNAANSPAEEIGQTLTGRYSNQTLMYLIGGAVLGVAGIIMAIKK